MNLKTNQLSTSITSSYSPNLESVISLLLKLSSHNDNLKRTKKKNLVERISKIYLEVKSPKNHIMNYILFEN